jgi:hypothetical protein
LRITIAVFAAFCAVAVAQTPLEFGIVRDLVGGTPRISVFSIKTRTVDGETTLQIAARAGVQFDCTRHTMLTDTVTASEVMMEGQICYSASIAKTTVEHFFTVIRNNMASFGSGGITRIQVDLITADEMSWMSASIPVARVDSLLSGTLSHLGFWSVTPMNEVEIGTGGTPVVNESPLPELHSAPAVPEVVEAVIQGEGNQAWKSLIFPGWGQISSGNGVGIVNILAEIGGAALLFTDDYDEVGMGLLGLNHIISFTDLL